MTSFALYDLVMLLHIVIFGILFFDCTTQLVGSSSQTRDLTWALAEKAQNPNHWTPQGIPKAVVF